jgi:hypothetical protein
MTPAVSTRSPGTLKKRHVALFSIIPMIFQYSLFLPTQSPQIFLCFVICYLCQLLKKWTLSTVRIGERGYRHTFHILRPEQCTISQIIKQLKTQLCYRRKYIYSSGNMVIMSVLSVKQSYCLRYYMCAKVISY